MQVEVVKTGVEHRRTLENLAQLYQYDFSEFEVGGVVNDSGLYPYVNLDPYWSEPDRHVFLLRVDGRWAGFALVSRHSYLSSAGDVMEISEFFVMRKYRGQGVGDTLARYVFSFFPGKWELQVTERNHRALHFWRRVVRDYTGGDFTEVYLDSGWHGPVISFGV